MSDFTVDVAAIQSAIVKNLSPNTNYSTETYLTAMQQQPNVITEQALMKFTQVPSDLVGRRVDSAEIRLYVTAKGLSGTAHDGGYFTLHSLYASVVWNESTVTYYSQLPVYDNVSTVYYSAIPSSGAAAFPITPQNALFIMQNSGVMLYSGAVLSASGYLTMTFNSTRAATNKPILRVGASKAVPSVYAASPNGASAYVFPGAAATFSWSVRDVDYASKIVFGAIQTSGSKFRHRVAGAGTYTEINLAANAHSISIPANTFTAATNYEWQVIETTTDAVSSSSTTWYPFTTTDATPDKAIAVSPNNEYIEVDKATTFEWEHVISTGSAPTGANLEYSLAGGAWTGFATVTGSSLSTTVAASTLPAGQLRWRVRTYNSDGVVGDWSDPVAIIGVGAPTAPTITSVTQCSRPVVSWQSLGQVAYQIQFGDLDTGEVAGTVKSYKLPNYIPNGTYTVRMRIKNASLAWSAWTEQTLILAVTGPTAPTLTASATTGAAMVSFSATGAERLYLLRDGVPIADVTGLTAYADYAALGAASYALRSVDASDNYADSAAAGVTVTVPNATLAAVDALSAQIALMLTRGEPTRLTGSISQNVTYRHYAGRTAPVAVYSGQESESYQIAVAFLQTTDRDNLIALIRRCKTLLYRDGWGNRWYVSVSSVGCDQDGIATTMKLNMTVVDYVEAIEYGAV